MIYEQVESLLKNDRVEEALDKALKHLAKDPKDAKAYTALADVYIEKEMYDEASVSALEAYKLNPKNIKTLECLGWLYLREGDSKSACEKFEEMLVIDKENAFALGNLGIIASSEKNYSMAEEYFKKALSVDENDATAWVNLGVLYSETMREEEALNAFNKASAIKKEDKRVKEYIDKMKKRKEEEYFSYAEFIPLPITPKLFHINVPSDWEALVEEDTLKIHSPEKRLILLLSYKSANPSKKDMLDYAEDFRKSKTLKAIIEPARFEKKEGETVLSHAFVESSGVNDVFYKIALFKYEGKTLYATFSSSYPYGDSVRTLTDLIFSSISLKV